MTPAPRSNTLRRPHMTTTRRSCWMRSCRQRPARCPLRLPRRARRHSTPRHRTCSPIPASTIARFRITPTMSSGMPMKRPPLRHPGSLPRRRSARPSTSLRGTTSPASRFARSTYRPGIRSPRRWRTRLNLRRSIPRPRNRKSKRLAISPQANRLRRSIPAANTTRNRCLQSIALHQLTHRSAVPIRMATSNPSFRLLPSPLHRPPKRRHAQLPVLRRLRQRRHRKSPSRTRQNA